MRFTVNIVSLLKKASHADYISVVAKHLIDKGHSVSIVYSHSDPIDALQELNGIFFEQEIVPDFKGETRSVKEFGDHHLKQCLHIVGLYNTASKLVKDGGKMPNKTLILEEGIRFNDITMVDDLLASDSGFSCISGVYPSRAHKDTNHIRFLYYSQAWEHIPNELVPRCVFPVAWAGAAVSVWFTSSFKKTFPIGMTGINNPFCTDAIEVVMWENFAAKRFLEEGMKWAVNGRVWCSHDS